jgi:hypothetical protein
VLARGQTKFAKKEKKKVLQKKCFTEKVKKKNVSHTKVSCFVAEQKMSKDLKQITTHKTYCHSRVSC